MPDEMQKESNNKNIISIDSQTIDSIVEGATLADGQTVQTVFSKGTNYVIYRTNEQFGFRYKYQSPTPETRESIRQFESLMSKAQKKLKGTPDDQLNSVAVSTLRSILQEKTAQIHQDAIATLEDSIDKLEEVSGVIGRGKAFAVWITESGHSRYSYLDSIHDVGRSISEYTRIKALARALLPEPYQSSFDRRLGAALVAAFKSGPEVDVAELFSPLDDYIQRHITNGLRIRYLAVTSSTAVFLVSMCYLCYRVISFPEFLHIGLVAIAGGYLGTFISVFERSKTLSIGDNESTKLIIFQGALRVLLGGLFGFIAYASAKSGMAFTLFKDTTAGLILLGVAAGFSERLIPDLIQGFSPGKDKKDQS